MQGLLLGHLVSANEINVKKTAVHTKINVAVVA